MLLGNRKGSRVLAAPFAVLGVVALFYLARGQRPPRTPESLLEHLNAQGIEAVLSDPWEVEEIGETYWTLRAGEHHFTLRRAQSVVAAMSEYKAMTGGSPGVPMNLYYGASDVYRNEIYLLELRGPGNARSAAIGQAFENW